MRIARVGVVMLVGVGLTGCGRVAFDPLDDAGGAGSSTGDGGGSGSGTADGGGAGPDGSVAACATALPVSTGTTVIDTCSTGVDLFDGCGPAGTQEVLLRFDVPVSRGYQFAAYDPGTQNVSTSTGLVNATCSGTSSCSGILGRSYAAGETVYIALEASSGGCVTVDFSIQ